MPRGLSSTRNLAIWAASHAAWIYVDSGRKGEPPAKFVKAAMAEANIQSPGDQRTFRATLKSEIARLTAIAEACGSLRARIGPRQPLYAHLQLPTEQCSCGADLVLECLDCGDRHHIDHWYVVIEVDSTGGGIIDVEARCPGCNALNPADSIGISDGDYAIGINYVGGDL